MSTSNDIIPFDFEGARVRTIKKDGEPWFALADVCRVLGHSNAAVVAQRLDEDEKGVSTVYTPGGQQTIAVVSESGLYSIVMTSRKPAAKRFKKWITSEVLPAIRRTGGYMMAAPDETPEALVLRAITVLQETVERQQTQLAEALPKVEALDRIATADGSLNLTAAAKALQVRPKALVDYLRRDGWIYKRPWGRSYLGYEAKTMAGLLEHKVTTVIQSDGREKILEQVLVTPKGLIKLAERLSARSET